MIQSTILYCVDTLFTINFNENETHKIAYMKFTFSQTG